MKRFLEVLKEQAGVFLIEKSDLIHFRTVLQADVEVRGPMSVAESELIEPQYQLLLEEVQQDLKDDGIKASAIVLTGKADGYNVVVIEIFSRLQDKFQGVFPYTLKGETVTFGVDLNKRYHTNSKV